jgi:hypothetical protein
MISANGDRIGKTHSGIVGFEELGRGVIVESINGFEQLILIQREKLQVVTKPNL